MRTITTDKLKTMLDGGEDVRLINVLAEEDFREAHIPGSVNVPVNDKNLEKTVEEVVGSKDATVIVYCASRECNASPTAAKRLEAAGFTDVIDYEDGIEGWRQAGLPVESGAVARR
jgi:rhodanese-related sulfurtransferase